MDCGDKKTKKKGMQPSTVVATTDLVKPSPGGIVSRELMRTDGGTMTAFAFDQGEGLSEHSAPFDAMVQVVSGRLDVTIGGELHQVGVGCVILMPADIPHALSAPEPATMLLVMLR